MIPRLVDAPRVVLDARAIVFDKDGTLLDLDSRWVAFFTGLTDRALEAVGASDLRPGVLSALGVGPTSLVPHGVAAAGTGADVRSAIIASLCAAGHDRSAVDAAVTDAYNSAPMGRLAALGDPVSTLTRLRDSGRHIGVATADDRERTVDDLVGLGVANLVDLVNCGDDPFSKPHPRVLTDMAESWGIEVGSIVMVGDSRHDLATARAAGARFISVGSAGMPDAEAWVETVNEIAEAIHSDASGE
jgi:phosphoglycolate phosphatase